MENIRQIESNVYEIRFAYQDPLTGKQRRVRRVFHGTFTEAKHERDRLRQRALDGTVNNPLLQLETLTPNDLLPLWKESRSNGRKRFAESTIDTENFYLDGHILPAIGDWRISAIQRRHLEQLIAQWENEKQADNSFYSATTVNNWISTMSRFLKFCFRHAERHDIALLAELPRVPVEAEPRGRALNKQEAQKLLEHLEESAYHWYALVLTALLTGQRWGSVTALRWQDITEHSIRFEQSHHRGRVKRGNKTHKILELPMPANLYLVLLEHKRRMEQEEHPGLASGLVFPSRVLDGEQNGFMDSSSCRKVLLNACEAINIPKITTHDLRRTANSWMIESGVSGPVVRAIMGHVTERMTDKYYRSSPEAKADALKTLSNNLPPKPQLGGPLVDQNANPK